MSRLCEEADINKIVSLELNLLNSTLGYESLKDYLKNPLINVLVDEIDNDVIGYISYSFDGEILEIYNFCVKEEYQRCGIGTKLINYAFDLCINKGLKSSILEVRESNIKAIAFYFKLGYKQIALRKNYYSNNEDALILQKLF